MSLFIGPRLYSLLHEIVHGLLLSESAWSIHERRGQRLAQDNQLKCKHTQACVLSAIQLTAIGFAFNVLASIIISYLGGASYEFLIALLVLTFPFMIEAVVSIRDLLCEAHQSNSELQERLTNSESGDSMVERLEESIYQAIDDRFIYCKMVCL